MSQKESYSDYKENARRMSKGILKRIPFIKSISQIPRNKKNKEPILASAREIMYVNRYGVTKKGTILLIFYLNRKASSINIRGNRQGMTIKDFKELSKDLWLFVGAGGVPEDPNEFALTRIDYLPDEYFTRFNEKPKHQGNLGDRFSVKLKHISWSSVRQAFIQGGDSYIEEFDRMFKD